MLFDFGKFHARNRRSYKPIRNIFDTQINYVSKIFVDWIYSYFPIVDSGYCKVLVGVFESYFQFLSKELKK